MKRLTYYLPADLERKIWHLKHGRTWAQVAGELNAEGARRVGRPQPWTRQSVADWAARGITWRGRAARLRDRRRRLCRHILELYVSAREHDRRMAAIQGKLLEYGFGEVSRQTISAVAQAAGVRARATAGHWRHVARIRPRLRADCRGGQRPCPWATCRYHLVPHLLASAERSYRNPANRSVPAELAPALREGDFSALEQTCVLDLLDARGTTDDRAGLVDAIADGSAIGKALGITRELVRLDVGKALAQIELLDPDLAAFLRRGYDVSKLGGDR